jgi:hypothetical protein
VCGAAEGQLTHPGKSWGWYFKEGGSVFPQSKARKIDRKEWKNGGEEPALEHCTGASKGLEKASLEVAVVGRCAKMREAGHEKCVAGKEAKNRFDG